MEKKNLFAYNVRLVRNARQLSAKDLAEKAGLKSGSRLLDIEEEKVPAKLEEAIAISKCLRLDLAKMVNQKATVAIEFLNTDFQTRKTTCSMCDGEGLVEEDGTKIICPICMGSRHLD